MAGTRKKASAPAAAVKKGKSPRYKINYGTHLSKIVEHVKFVNASVAN